MTKLKIRWEWAMRYLIATLKDGDNDGWAEAQLIKLAEDLDANDESEDAEPIEVPRHGGNRPGIGNRMVKEAIEQVVANTEVTK